MFTACLVYRRLPENVMSKRWATWLSANMTSTMKLSTTFHPSALISSRSCWLRNTANVWRVKSTFCFERTTFHPPRDISAHEALRHKWVKRKPQYTPTNAKPSSSPLSFKAVYLDKVRKSFLWWFNFVPSAVPLHLQRRRASFCYSTMLCVANESRFGDCTNFSFKRNSINESSHPLCLRFGEVWFLLKLFRVGKFWWFWQDFSAVKFYWSNWGT